MLLNAYGCILVCETLFGFSVFRFALKQEPVAATRSVFTKNAKRLCVPQRFNWIESGGSPRWVQPEQHPNDNGDANS